MTDTTTAQFFALPNHAQRKWFELFIRANAEQLAGDMLEAADGDATARRGIDAMAEDFRDFVRRKLRERGDA